VGSNLVVGYIYSADNAYHYNTVNTTTYLAGTLIPTGYTLATTIGATYISVNPGHTTSQAIFTYEYSGLGRIVVVDITTNTVIAGPIAFSIAPITYSISNASTDKDGN